VLKLPESRKRKIVHGTQRKPEFAGNRKRMPMGEAPKLEFGQFGELTPKTIRQAHLSKEEEDRAWEMLHVQNAYLQIVDCLSYPVDPEGHIHDLSAIGPTKLAIAWTLALNGFRPTGPKYIKKRPFSAPGCYKDAHTWVDVRQPDDAAQELRPEHRSGDYKLPPDTRRLAAQRDGEQPDPPPAWSVRPEVSVDFVPRAPTEEAAT
jgi:hypothetical protein